MLAGTPKYEYPWSWISKEICGFVDGATNKDLGIKIGVYVNPSELNSLREACQERMKAVKK